MFLVASFKGSRGVLKNQEFGFRGFGGVGVN